MAFKDILLTLTSYPEPTPVSVLEDAVSIAASLARTLPRFPARCTFRSPATSFPGSIANIPGIIAGEAEKSRKSAKDMLAAFDAAAAKAGVLHETYHGKMPDLRRSGPVGRLCAASRSHDRPRAGEL